MTMLASHITINTDFFSTTHRISGKVQMGANGLLGLLNDVNTSLVEVDNAYLSRLAEPSKIEAHLERMSVNKHNLVFVIVNRREDLGPVGLARGGYTHVTSVPVLFTTAVYEIRGTVETTSKLDAGALLTGGTGKYLPVYKVSLHSTLYPETPFTGEAIALNRTLVETLAALPKGKA